MSLDLNAIAERYRRALDAKPGKGPISEAGIAAITDSVCDVPDLMAEIERLNRWKSEAWPVMEGLQDLGAALGLPLGELITGPAAVAAVASLTAERDRLRADLQRYAEKVGRVQSLIRNPIPPSIEDVMLGRTVSVAILYRLLEEEAMNHG